MKRVYGGLVTFRRRHFEGRRVGKALLVAIPTILIGNWLLHFEVSNLGLDPIWAWRANWPVITFLCFVLNRAFTWDDRQREKVSLAKWILISAIHSSVSQYLYPQLVHAGINYMLASVVMMGLGPVSFVLNNLITFRKKTTDMA